MVPIKYNIKSLFIRKATTLMTILSIAFVVLVYIGILSLGEGLRMAFGASGDSSTVIVLRRGTDTETQSYFPSETHRILSALPGVAMGPDGDPLASGETLTLQIVERPDGSETNIVLRGVEKEAFLLRPFIELTEGRTFVPGTAEVIVGRQLAGTSTDLGVGGVLELGRLSFDIVGIFDAEGSSYSSEIWGDTRVFGDAFRRTNYYSSTRLKADSQSDVQTLINAAENNQQIVVDALDEVSYFEAQSTRSSAVFLLLGNLVAFMMGFGACFAAANTMFSQVSARSKEIAAMRVLGFPRRTIMSAFLLEACVLGLVAGLLGALFSLPFNGISAATSNFFTFSQINFVLRTTPDVLLTGIALATITAVLGGVFPAWSASRAPIPALLREG